MVYSTSLSSSIQQIWLEQIHSTPDLTATESTLIHRIDLMCAVNNRQPFTHTSLGKELRSKSRAQKLFSIYTDCCPACLRL